MASPLPPGIRLRTGRPADAPLIRRAILREKMNPLGCVPALSIEEEQTCLIHTLGPTRRTRQLQLGPHCLPLFQPANTPLNRPRLALARQVAAGAVHRC